MAFVKSHLFRRWRETEARSKATNNIFPCGSVSPHHTHVLMSWIHRVRAQQPWSRSPLSDIKAAFQEVLESWMLSLIALRAETRCLPGKVSEVLRVQNGVASAKSSKEKVVSPEWPCLGPRSIVCLRINSLYQLCIFLKQKTQKRSASDFLLSRA